MKYKLLGRTRQKIPVIGQGCMGIGGYFSADTSNDSQQIKNVLLGIELGMTFIDTAEIYGMGHSEELIGSAVQSRRDTVFIASKASPEHIAYDNLIKACEGSLRRLNTDYIDLYQIHWPNPTVPIQETMDAMNMLKHQGKIRYLGVCNFSMKQFREAQAACGVESLVSTQLEYNLFDRTVENDMLPFCKNEALSLIAYSPLNQGRMQYSKNQKKTIDDIAHKYGKTPAQIALRCLIDHPSVIAIPKANKPEHIRQNADVADINLDQKDIEAINYSFQMQIISIPVEKINVVLNGQGNRFAYRTLHDALENSLGFCPGPGELAEDILRLNEPIKPVRVRKTLDTSCECEYDLIEGRIRYWAWVIAHEGKRAIPALLYEDI